MKHKTMYIKTDDNKVINKKYIRWVKKMGDCMEVCTKSNGCVLHLWTFKTPTLF